MPDETAKAMTTAQAAKAVYRMVPEMKNGKPVTDEKGVPVLIKKAVPVKDIMSFKDYGTHVVVVTTAGEKLSSE